MNKDFYLDLIADGNVITSFDKNSSIQGIFDIFDDFTEDSGYIDDVILKIRVEISESKKISEKYVEDAPGEYTIWSASDLADTQIPLVKIKTDDNGDLYAEAVGDDEFDQESYRMATNVINTAKKGNKTKEYTLTRIDKTLNHNDQFFSVEFDRNLVNNTTELIAAQALRTLRDDLKAFVANKKNITEEDVVEKFKELTGVDYYTDKIVDKDQYDHILVLLLKDPTDKYNYINPEENGFIQGLKNLTEDLIEKVLLRNDPDFYK